MNNVASANCPKYFTWFLQSFTRINKTGSHVSYISSLALLKTVIQQFFSKNKFADYFVAGGCAVFFLMSEKGKLTEASHQKDLQHLNEKAALQNQVQQLKDRIKSDSVVTYFTVLMLAKDKKHQTELLDLKNEVNPQKKITELIAEITSYSHIDLAEKLPNDLKYMARYYKKEALIQQLKILLKKTNQEKQYQSLTRVFYGTPFFNFSDATKTVSDKYPDLFSSSASNK